MATTRCTPNYADGVARPVSGPPARRISNRVFNDIGQNIFSERSISQWGWAWGQFMDHDFGLRDSTPAEHTPIAFNAADPLEAFRNDFGVIDFFRTPAAPGTGVGTPRQQINTISSFIDASGAYGVTADRLEWLRDGPVDGNVANNGATLLLPHDYLPRRDARGDAATAPVMELQGALAARPARAAVAGDIRANENIALTSIHTLFAREHNRIVAALQQFPTLSEEDKFQIARRVVGAELQFITYTQFLPAIGVELAPYMGYNPTVNPGLSNEFAVTGYRAHSMIHGEFEPTVPAGTFTPAQLDAFRRQGIIVEQEGNNVTLVIPLVIAFGNPDLLEAVGIDRFLPSLGAEPQYKNDEQIDNALRSVLFQVPRPAPKASFKDITGESTESFPADPLITGNPIDDPNILDFVQLRDINGQPVEPFGEGAVVGIRRTTTAARLKAIYGNVNKVDSFVGMVSEPHLRGKEVGELQNAIWKKQFEALRDGGRFFYQIDHELSVIQLAYGIDFRHTLAQIIRMNTDAEVADDVFRATG